MAEFTTKSKAFPGAALLAAALFLSGCGDDGGSIASPAADDSPSDATEASDPPAADTDADATDDAAAPAAGAGTGTITVGDTTWEIEGTCNNPMEGVVLLTGTAVSDPTIEIYVTATPGLPDTDSAFVTKEGEFDWSTGSFVTSKGLQEPDTSYDVAARVGRGSAGFIDQDQPPLDEVYADGTWEFNC